MEKENEEAPESTSKHNLNKWTEMTNIEIYRTVDDRDEWRRPIEKAEPSTTMMMPTGRV